MFAGDVRLRDLVMVAGARDNQLVGFGLVVGLAGDGDKDPVYTQQTIANMLQRYGINVPATTIVREKCGRRHGHGGHPGVRRNKARALMCRCPRWATRNRCKAACCCKRRCSARTTKFMPWRKGRLSVGGFSVGTGGGGGATVTKNHPTVGADH